MCDLAVRTRAQGEESETRFRPALINKTHDLDDWLTVHRSIIIVINILYHFNNQTNLAII